jgi:peptidoglycan lytic transglycosylase G
VVEPPDLSREPRGTVPPLGPPRRPNRGQVVRRRAAALILIAVLVGAGVWAATAAIRTTGHKKAAPATTATLGPAKSFRIIFPEGFTREQIADRIAAVAAIAKQKRGFTPRLTPDAYLAATASSALPGQFAGDKKARSLEGFLFPAAYDLFQNDRANVLVKKQLDTFHLDWAQVKLGYARSKNLTPYDVLIIASMVEKEVVAPSERALVAAVIYNRLHARMPLGIDATLRYGLDIPPTKAITESQLQSDSPYNTRKFRGLPPTPIANPGLPSMIAAAHPARVAYIYFVRKPDCKHHYFTASAAQFDLDVRKGGLRCSAGKPG